MAELYYTRGGRERGSEREREKERETWFNKYYRFIETYLTTTPCY